MTEISTSKRPDSAGEPPPAPGARCVPRLSAGSVVVNARCFDRPLTGVERYAREVMARLNGNIRVSRPPHRMSGWRGHLWEQLELPRVVNRDLLWSPANTGPLAVRRQVITVHDLAVIDHPEWFEPKFAAWYRFLLPRLARRVAHIVTGSVFSKSRIVDRLGVAEDCVSVFPYGVGEAFNRTPSPSVADVRRRFGLHSPYILTVGSLEPRKNLRRLLQAWDAVGAVSQGLMLIVVGDARPTLRRVFVPSDRPSVRWLNDVNDDDLPGLYAGALGFVLPSLYEGFGLPVLEAMACGTPVMCSNVTALPEIAADAAITVDPSDGESMMCGLRQLMSDADKRVELRRLGLERAAAFSWDRTAFRTWRLLMEVSDGR